jgi:hypothetical protein
MEIMKKLLLIMLIQGYYLTAISQDFWEEIILPDSFAYRCMDIGSNGDIYLGMWGFSYPGGIYRSTDNTQTWQYLGLEEKPIYAIEVCSNGDILAGVYHGMYKSSDNGQNWYEVYFEVENVTNIISLSNGYVFAGGTGNLHGIIRSTDFGETWDTVHVFTNYGQENLEALTLSPEGSIWAGTHNIFGEGSITFSTDLGETWTKLSTPDFSPYWPWIFSLAIHPQGDLFAGFYGQGLYRYNFTIEQWTLLYNPWITPDDILFVGDNKIFVGLEQDPNGFDGIIYSDDGGQNFATLNSGINGGSGGSINYLFRHPSKYIYAVGYGFYRSVESVITAIDENNHSDKCKSWSFPNPFKDQTKILWHNSSNEENVEIIVTDVSGVIIQKGKIRNTGDFLFHPVSIKQGIYYYSIAGKNNIYSGKMIFIK